MVIPNRQNRVILGATLTQIQLKTMKKALFLVVLVFSAYCYAQVPAYYNDVNLTLTGSALKTELATKVTNTQTTVLSYTPGVWDALKQADLDPTNANKVILIYGYNDTDGVLSTDRTRGKDNNGGDATDWNREHVYPRSLGNPNLGSTGPGSDAHHLRPADPARNSSRSNRKFATGTGNSGVTAQGNYYPGDEFKGDVARMMMFMYLRYGDRCLAANVGVGNAVVGDPGMIDLFLQWNVDDPVSNFELNRNVVIEGIQGNRNPFIDNPAFATTIWGGPQAEDRFDGSTGGENTLCTSTITAFPYSESYESDFGGWNQASTDDFNWARRSGGTPSSGTGPSSASAGSTYIYMESSTPNYSAKRAILYGPCFSVPTGNTSFTFKYHMYGAAQMGRLDVEASLNGTTWTSIWNKSGNQGNSWRSAVVDLSTYAGSSVQLRLNGVTGTTWQGDMAVDNLEVTTGGTGGGGVTTLDVNLRITFDNYPEETSWEIRDDANQVVFSGGTYGSQADGSTLNLIRMLDVGCYSLVFSDVYGDGICCSYGNGSYALTNTEIGTTLASGGSFGSQEVTNFCVTTTRMATTPTQSEVQQTLVDLVFYPNPTADVLNIQHVGLENCTYEIYNELGQVMQKGVEVPTSIIVSSWNSGIYYLAIQTPLERRTKSFIVK